jgi:hypothetical protein
VLLSLRIVMSVCHPGVCSRRLPTVGSTLVATWARSCSSFYRRTVISTVFPSPSDRIKPYQVRPNSSGT